MPIAPDHPAGPFVDRPMNQADRRRMIDALAEAPARLRTTITGLQAGLLDTRYSNWTVRQIVHHIADSHLHSYVRFKWTLTEDRPTIKAYDENTWSALPDAIDCPIEPSLLLLDGLHARWVTLLRSVSDDDFARSFTHPQTGQTHTLDTMLAYYVWHGRHHTAQIQWLCDHVSKGAG